MHLVKYIDLNKFFYLAVSILIAYLSNTTLANAAYRPPILSKLIQEANLNNPQIKAARKRWIAAKDVIPQSRTLPDPKVDLGYIKMSGNNPMDVDPRREQMIGLSQEIPFPMKLYLKGKVATLDAKRVNADYRSTQLAVIAQLKMTYYDLYFVNKSIEIYRRNQVLLEKMEKSARVTYSVGKTPQQDIFRAQTEISRILMRLVMLRQERSSLEADINRLLNRALDISVPTPSSLLITPLHYNLSHLYQLVDQQSPQLQAQQKNVEKSHQEVNLSKQDYYPDIEIGAGKLRDTAMGTQGYQVMLSATIPLYFASKQNYEVKESIARYNANIDDLYTTHRELSFQAKNDYLLIQRSVELINFIRHTIIPQATLTFKSSQATYGVGKVDFLTLLNNLLTLQDNELELHSEIAQHEKAMAKLEEITGVTL